MLLRVVRRDDTLVQDQIMEARGSKPGGLSYTIIIAPLVDLPEACKRNTDTYAGPAVSSPVRTASALLFAATLA
jgi:hypothetical protein